MIKMYFVRIPLQLLSRLSLFSFFQEVIMMLEQATKDFKSLIERLKMMKWFEDVAKDGDR